MVPTVELPPANPLTFHETVVLVVPVTVAAKLWDLPVCTVAEVGEIEMATVGGGVVMLTLALADFEESAELVAVMVTALPEGEVAGA
jgi:hypothetical protein